MPVACGLPMRMQAFWRMVMWHMGPSPWHVGPLQQLEQQLQPHPE